jgi:hypothetical protein
MGTTTKKTKPIDLESIKPRGEYISQGNRRAYFKDMTEEQLRQCHAKWPSLFDIIEKKSK